MNQKPTKVRYQVLFVVCLVYLITYLDRVNLSVATPLMMKHFHVNKLQWGIVFSVFMWTYSGFQIPIGMLGDKFGPRKVLAGLVAAWSMLTAATGMAWSFPALVAIRALFGIGEAGAFPNATRAFSYWMPSSQRGLAQGLTHGAARFGGAVTPVIVTALMARWGWRSSFYIFGAVGLVWAGFWLWWYRDKPAEFRERSGAINQAELDLIESGLPAKKGTAKLKFRTLIKSRNMWFLSLSYLFYSYVSWIYLLWLPTYLVEARGFSMLKMGVFASLPLFAGVIGDTMGGWLSDKIWRWTGRGKFARRVVAMSGMLIATAFMLPGVLTHSAYLAVFLFACSLFGLEMAVGVYWTVCLDVGHEYAGTVSGMMNSIGNIGSAISPIAFGAIVQYTGSWVYPFLVGAAVLVIGVLFWLGVNPELSVVDELGLREAGKATAPAQ